MTVRASQTHTNVDSTVIDAAKNGLESAWGEIYSELAGPITGYLRSRGAADPEDLSSEVFFQIARDIHRFSGDQSQFRSWVFVIAHRRLIDQRRANGRRPERIDIPLTEFDDQGGNVEDEVMAELSTANVEEILESLTEDQRHVLVLRIIGDLTLEETASVMSKRVGAVKALQRRALAAVKSRIEEGSVTL